MGTSVDELVRRYHETVKQNTKKYDILKDLDVFVLDNSIRESTVGQLRGHTIENKFAIFDEVKKCGFKDIIVASFGHMTRVDDEFIQALIDRGEDLDHMWSFSEVVDSAPKRVPDVNKVPVGLRKNEEFGLRNIIFEIDLGDHVYDFNSGFSMDDMCALVKKWIVYAKERIHKNAKLMINFRDLPDVMATQAQRVFQLVQYVGALPPELQLFGLVYEEPLGRNVPERVAAWAKYLRLAMDANNMKGKHLLVHVHEKFGLCDVTALECLMNGANGIWASTCIEGAAMGNAASTVTLTNIIRMGNKKVLEKYNCSYLRKAAINVTKITTGELPHRKQPVYGQRALDTVFSFETKDGFDLASFFEEEGTMRISTMASGAMICTQLKTYFDEDPQFTDEIGDKMKSLILDDLRDGRKEEYQSKVGLALLFDRAGGSLTEEMRDAINEEKMKSPHAQQLINQIREQWDTWDNKEEASGDGCLEFNSFYNGFLAPYFGCYTCKDTKKAMSAIDMDSDGKVDWSEFVIYLRWAIRQYPKTMTSDELLEIAFTKGLMPAMRDELARQEAAQ